MNIIAAVDENMGIGYKGELLFNIPEDKKYFKEKTTGNTIIMGRKTFESLPFRPLPDRRNIVLTKNRKLICPGADVCFSVKELSKMLRDTPTEKIFVIGGEEIYRLLLPYCDMAFITKIFASKNADKFIHDFDNDKEWYISEQSGIKEYNGLKYRFVTYTKGL